MCTFHISQSIALNFSVRHFSACSNDAIRNEDTVWGGCEMVNFNKIRPRITLERAAQFITGFLISELRTYVSPLKPLTMRVKGTIGKICRKGHFHYLIGIHDHPRGRCRRHHSPIVRDQQQRRAHQIRQRWKTPFAHFANLTSWRASLTLCFKREDWTMSR